MTITLIGGGVIDSDNIIFHVDALNNGTSPVFVAADTNQSLDNLLKVADMDNLFSGDGWDYDKWNAWRAAHPYSPATYTPFQNQDSIPGTSIIENLGNQNLLATAGNYYLDAAAAAIKNNPVAAVGVFIVGGLIVWAIVAELRD
jgi:hypothetical protein